MAEEATTHRHDKEAEAPTKHEDVSYDRLAAEIVEQALPLEDADDCEMSIQGRIDSVVASLSTVARASSHLSVERYLSDQASFMAYEAELNEYAVVARAQLSALEFAIEASQSTMRLGFFVRILAALRGEYQILALCAREKVSRRAGEDILERLTDELEYVEESGEDYRNEALDIVAMNNSLTSGGNRLEALEEEMRQVRLKIERAKINSSTSSRRMAEKTLELLSEEADDIRTTSRAKALEFLQKR